VGWRTYGKIAPPFEIEGCEQEVVTAFMHNFLGKETQLIANVAKDQVSSMRGVASLRYWEYVRMAASYLVVAIAGTVAAIVVYRQLPAIATPLAIFALAGSCFCLVAPLRGWWRHQYKLWFMVALAGFAFSVPIAAPAEWIWGPYAVFGALCVVVLCLYLRFSFRIVRIGSRYRRLRKSD
jgi:hypothetical protein